MVCIGVTHCNECWNPLREDEWGICTSCRNKKDLDKVINSMVKEEISKKDTLIIVKNGKEKRLKGKWKDNKFIID